MSRYLTACVATLGLFALALTAPATADARDRLKGHNLEVPAGGGAFEQREGLTVGVEAVNFAISTHKAVTDVSVVATRVSVHKRETGAGMIARFSGTPARFTAYEALLVHNKDGNYSANIYRVVDSKAALLTSRSVVVNGPVTLRFEVKGHSLQFFVNDVFAAGVTDRMLPDQGLVGFVCNQRARFEEFRATTLRGPR